MPRLKTYEAEIDGLHQWIVAAPNQRAALDAFGVHQDLFAQGLARVAQDPEAIEAASAAAGQPLRRLKGTKEPFRPVDSGGQGAWEKAAAALAKPGGKPKPPSRTRLDRAEAAARAFEKESAAELEALAQARAELQAREARVRADLEARRKKLEEDLDAARLAYRDAGGKL